MPLPVWIAIGLALILVFTFEGAHRVIAELSALPREATKPTDEIDAIIQRLASEVVQIYGETFKLSELFQAFGGEFAAGFDDDYIVQVTNRALRLSTPDGGAFPFDEVRRALGSLAVEGLVKSRKIVGKQYQNRLLYPNPVETGFYTLEPLGSEVLKVLRTPTT